MKGSDRMRTGKKGEDIAIAYLKSRGYRIVERNYICPLAEIDIVPKTGMRLSLCRLRAGNRKSLAIHSLLENKAEGDFANFPYASKGKKSLSRRREIRCGGDKDAA